MSDSKCTGAGGSGLLPEGTGEVGGRTSAEPPRTSPLSPSLPFPGDGYDTPEGVAGPIAGRFPTFCFFAKLIEIIRRNGSQAATGVYSGGDWSQASLDVLRALESCGLRIHTRGMDVISRTDGPCLFIGNHMSTLETFVLPIFIQPRKDVTFVVKQNLLQYPWFKHVLASRDPITVGRLNPREDLTAVLDGGLQRLKNGRSIIIFPQSTRNVALNPEHFNSIGIKLAKRAGVPVIPVALRTDAWGTSHGPIKDLGWIRPDYPVHFAFGEPIYVQGNGKAEHAKVYNFIESYLKEWNISASSSNNGEDTHGHGTHV